MNDESPFIFQWTTAKLQNYYDHLYAAIEIECSYTQSQYLFFLSVEAELIDRGCIKKTLTN